MSDKKTVSVWINEDNHLCFFAGDDTLCIRNWQKFAKALTLRWVGDDFWNDYDLFDEPEEFEGEFCNTAEALADAAQQLLDGMEGP